MLSFFPTPYPDELLYGVCSRYHTRSGNISTNATMRELFGNNKLSSKLLLPTHIKKLADNLPILSGITVEYIIDNMTLFRYFSAFMDNERKTKLKNLMEECSNKSTKLNAGLSSNSVQNFKTLRVCPDCFIEDRSLYGEAYLHRIHQIFGVFVCPKHNTATIDTGLLVNDLNKKLFYNIDYYEFENIERPIYEDNLGRRLFELSKSIESLLNLNTNINIFELFSLRNNILINKQYIHPKGRVYRSKIFKSIIDYYGEDFFELLGLEINLNQNNNWFFRLLKCRLSRKIDPHSR